MDLNTPPVDSIHLIFMFSLYLTLKDETVSDLKTQFVPRSKHSLPRL